MRGPRAAFDAVRAGWAMRWREHPPMLEWARYRLFDRRMPVAYRAWARDDIDGFWYPLRRVCPGLLVFLLVVELPSWATDYSSGRLGWLACYAAVSAVVYLVAMPQKERGAAQVKHVALGPGEPLFAGALVAQDVPCTRLPARSTLPWAVRLMALAAAASLAAALAAPRGAVGAVACLLVALGVGLVGAVVTRARLGRLLADRADQPHRLLRAVGVTDRSMVVVCAAGIAVLAWAEVTGRVVLGPSVVLGACAMVVLPGALVALAATRAPSNADLTGADLWWVAARGRLPRVDRPVRAARPLDGPVPAGARVPPETRFATARPTLP